MQLFQLSHTRNRHCMIEIRSEGYSSACTAVLLHAFEAWYMSFSWIIKCRKNNTHVHTYMNPPPNTYTHLIHLGWSPNVSALWHAKHSVNISQRMVTVTMAARQLKHGTVVLFNIWPRRSTACFYPIILSQERRLLRADVPTPLCSPT